MFLTTDSPPAHWILALPRPNRRLTALATIVATCARPLIAAGGGRSLLGVTAEADDTVRITWWNDQLAAYAELSARRPFFCPEESAEGALQRSGATFLAYLAGRWPPETVPTSLGVVTDGFGIVFSPGHPSPRVAGWLQSHGAGETRPLAILPFTPFGSGALLAADPRCGTFH